MPDPRPELVRARGLRKTFRRRAVLWGSQEVQVHAVAGVDLEVHAGETVGLVGESGSGKSTLGRLLIRLIEADAGSLSFDGIDLLALKPGPLRAMRRPPPSVRPIEVPTRKIAPML